MRLYWKIYCVVFILFMAVTALSSYVTLARRISESQKSSAEEYRIIGSFVSSEIERSQSESEWPFESLNKLTAYEDFMFWWIVQENGTIHLANDASFIGTDSRNYFLPIPKDPPENQVILNKKKNYGIFINSLEVESKRWLFFLGFSTKHIAQASKKIIQSTVLYSASALAILGIVLYFVIIYFLRPINSLAAGAKKIGKGDFDWRIEVKSNDELSSLASSFNKMSEDLQRTTTSIDSLNREITERKNIETALRKSEERFMQVVESAGDWIWEVNIEGLYTYASPIVERVLGYKPEEIVGKKHFYDLFASAPDVKEELKKAALEAFAKRESIKSLINPNMHKNGSTVIMETSGTPIIDEKGKLCGYRGADKDITERKQTYELLKKSENKYRMLIENIPQKVFFKDRNSVYISCNKNYAADLDIEPEEIAGRTDFDFYSKELADKYRFDDSRVMESAQGEEIDEKYVWNGKEIFIHTVKTPVKDEHDKVIGVLGVFWDITERKQAEAELKAAQDNLIEMARKVGMAEVAADVLHNVGNVLNSVNVSTTIIREKVTNSELPNLEKVASIINEHTEDLGTFLTEDPQGKHIPVYLTEVSKCLTDEQTDIISRLRVLTDNVQHIKDIVSMQQSYAKVSGVKVQTSISKLVKDAIQINSAGLERHGTRLICEFEELPDVEIDKQKVLQVLVNLISNAKYALSDSNREEKLLTIRLYKHGEGRFRIEVADNGVGIAKDNLTKIFSHGFTTKKHGHGFGLHSCALASKEIGGSLTVNSDGVGRGATFTLELPFKPVEIIK